METLKERQHHVHMKGMEFIWIAVWSIPMQANLVRLVYAKWNQGASYTSCTQSGTIVESFLRKNVCQAHDTQSGTAFKYIVYVSYTPS